MLLSAFRKAHVTALTGNRAVDADEDDVVSLTALAADLDMDRRSLASHIQRSRSGRWWAAWEAPRLLRYDPDGRNRARDRRTAEQGRSWRTTRIRGWKCRRCCLPVISPLCRMYRVMLAEGGEISASPGRRHPPLIVLPGYQRGHREIHLLLRRRRRPVGDVAVAILKGKSVSGALMTHRAFGFISRWTVAIEPPSVISR